MRLLVRCAVLCAISIISGACPACAQDEPPVYRHEISHPLAYAPTEEPSWLGPALKRLSRSAHPHEVLSDHVLFRFRNRPSWLAIIWDSREYGISQFELYQVSDADRPAPILRRRVRGQDGQVAVREPSGADFFDDGSAVLAVSYGGGGSNLTSYGEVIYRLGTKAIPFDFPGEMVSGLFDLRQDGRFELLTNDVRWHGFWEGANWGGFFEEIVRVWNGDRFVEACRDFPQVYAVSHHDEDEALKVTDLTQFLAANLSHTADTLQAGHISEASNAYKHVIARARKLVSANIDDARIDNAVIDMTKREFDPVFLHPAAKAACPATADQAKRQYSFNGPEAFLSVER